MPDTTVVVAWLRVPGQRWRLVASGPSEEAVRAALAVEARKHRVCDLFVSSRGTNPNED